MKRLLVIFLLLSGCASVGEVKLVGSSLDKPEFVAHVPKGCIVGFSSSAESLEMGKKLALMDAMEQICGAIGSEMHVEFEAKATANGRHVNREIKDTGRLISAALLREVEPNVRQLYFEKYQNGADYFFDTYVLVYFPEPKIRELRSLVLEENKKRLAEFKGLAGIAQELETKGDFIGSVQGYVSAGKAAELLFKDRLLYENIARQGLESVFSSLRIANVGEDRNALMLRVMFQGMPVKDLPLSINLIKGAGTIPGMIFTDDKGMAALDISRIVTAADNRISVSPKPPASFSVEIAFSTIEKAPIVEASVIMESFELAGLLVKKVEKAVLSLHLKEVNGVDFVLDRYRLKATAYYPVFMKDGFDTAAREADFFLQSPLRLNGNSKTLRIQLDPWACRMLSDLMKDRRPAKLRIEIGLSDEGKNTVFASTGDFSL